MEDGILQELQMKWEAKLLETRVADFARAPRPNPESDDEPPPPPNAALPQPVSNTNTPINSTTGLAYAQQYPQGLALPNVPGVSRPTNTYPQNGFGEIRVKTEVEDVLRPRGGALDELEAVIQYRRDNVTPIPIVLRPRGGVSEEGDIKPKVEPNAAGLLPGDEIIDSDLDDSDREAGEEDDEEGDVDIVFCVYDKVQRVKNKWKTVFKDGLVHINGRDYLFTRCTGEFEW
ncbi:hypothetical protein TREMEDRAFT_64096 [Tremella mesenterica DSM 1558]|uniref:uncharacterized protein n=1 Tax=Tremella mesenterica (strain ATCC 24925 / CBS 8224 / DSM 1558 / NBRC 9311 / NRRL Y-6157 / RJB 2259-6 / UBC 559-6) TaxID=578456 RepID=UPI0003F4A0E5|nr:uncharacterized protein TREMEDRAFT_64096 [Tremella mesenterica DSM 1558]EIW67514.1 hypothetical protein TREMEDRAFT_64096 [Tremella mesenterica DSM 1558]